MFSHLSSSVIGTSNRNDGSRQRAIPSSIMSTQFAIPTETLRRSFSRLAEPFHDKRTPTIKESEKLAELRDTFLPKLLSGEVRVPEAEKRMEAAV